MREVVSKWIPLPSSNRLLFSLHLFPFLLLLPSFLFPSLLFSSPLRSVLSSPLSFISPLYIFRVLMLFFSYLGRFAESTRCCVMPGGSPSTVETDRVCRPLGGSRIRTRGHCIIARSTTIEPPLLR